MISPDFLQRSRSRINGIHESERERERILANETLRDRPQNKNKTIHSIKEYKLCHLAEGNSINNKEILKNLTTLEREQSPYIVQELPQNHDNIDPQDRNWTRIDHALMLNKKVISDDFQLENHKVLSTKVKLWFKTNPRRIQNKVLDYLHQMEIMYGQLLRSRARKD